MSVKIYDVRCLSWLVLVILFFTSTLSAASTPPDSTTGIAWQSNYAKAVELAEQHQKMLFIFFYESDNDRLSQYFEWNVLGCKPIMQKLKDYVCVKLRRDASIRVGGQEIKVIEHAAFSKLNGQSGFAVLDFVHKDADYYGYVVSAFPFSDCRCYSVGQMAVILDLPSGRPEQRRAAYLIRTRIYPGRNRSAITAAPNLRPDADIEEVRWLTDYAEAMAIAESQKKMLFVYFCDCGSDGPCERFKAETLNRPQVQSKLRDYVCVQVPLDAKIVSGGNQVTLLEHGAFREMLAKPGIAIVDFLHSDPQLHGMVISIFPITGKLWYTPKQMATILDLPSGTLTQRTLIYAVRVHPDEPASTNSELSNDLCEEAEKHSQYQADLQLQGHHHWETRFHRINAKLPGGLTAKEVCAESWPGENLVEAAVECVHSWRQSDGHWNAVLAPNHYFGYDMKRGTNNVWYATGIFGIR